MPASPRSTSTPLSPFRTAANTPSSAEVSAARSSNALMVQPPCPPRQQRISLARPGESRQGRRRTIIPPIPPPEPAGPAPTPQFYPEDSMPLRPPPARPTARTVVSLSPFFFLATLPRHLTP